MIHHEGHEGRGGRERRVLEKDNGSFSYLCLHNKLPQNLMVYNNNVLSSLTTLWVDWAFLGVLTRGISLADVVR